MNLLGLQAFIIMPSFCQFPKSWKWNRSLNMATILGSSCHAKDCGAEGTLPLWFTMLFLCMRVKGHSFFFPHLCKFLWASEVLPLFFLPAALSKISILLWPHRRGMWKSFSDKSYFLLRIWVSVGMCPNIHTHIHTLLILSNLCCFFNTAGLTLKDGLLTGYSLVLSLNHYYDQILVILSLPFKVCGSTFP